MLIISLLLVILGGVFYELVEKFAPKKENHFSYLLIAYISAELVLLTYLIIIKYDFNNLLSDVNIVSFLVGAVAMFSDYGLIMSYNAGWKLSKLNITYSIFVFFILLAVEFLFLNGQISALKLLGILLCIGALFLMNYSNANKKGNN